MSFVAFPPGTMLSPVPIVMLSCAGESVRPNIITLAWAGTVCSQPPMLTVSIRKERYSHKLVTETGEFVVNMVSRDLIGAADRCGVKSGRDEDKFATCALTPVRADGMRYAPAIAQCPGYLACRVKSVTELGTHDMFLGEIVAVGIQDTLFDAQGKLDLGKARLAAYCHGAYRALGEAIGYFGFSVSAPDVYKRRMRELKTPAAPAKKEHGR
jgi:flavin reductase (DIM6/NTAB) family NADH-FMN oxidoreductase RutF